MKCLSIKQPWAGLIVLGIKDVENRSWPIRHIGPLLIHAGKEVDPVAWENYCGQKWCMPRERHARVLLADLRERGVNVDQAFSCGAIVGQATVYQCGMLRHGESGMPEILYASGLYKTACAPQLSLPEWHDMDCWGAYLRDARMLPQPVPYPGRLGLFEVPEHVVQC